MWAVPHLNPRPKVGGDGLGGDTIGAAKFRRAVLSCSDVLQGRSMMQCLAQCRDRVPFTTLAPVRKALATIQHTATDVANTPSLGLFYVRVRKRLHATC